MTLEELKQEEWYKTRPEIIKKAIEILPPNQIYKFKSTGKECVIVSYEEPDSGLIEEVTVTVQKIGLGGPLAEIGLGSLDTNSVFGVGLYDLEPAL